MPRASILGGCASTGDREPDAARCDSRSRSRSSRESLAAAVVDVAVDLDDQALGRPEEVDGVAARRERSPRVAEHDGAGRGEEVTSRLAVGLGRDVARQPDDGSPRDSAARVARLTSAAERRGRGPRGFGRACHRDAVANRRRTRTRACGAVDADAPTRAERGWVGDSDVTGAVPRPQQLPELGGAAVAENGPVATARTAAIQRRGRSSRRGRPRRRLGGRDGGARLRHGAGSSVAGKADLASCAMETTPCCLAAIRPTRESGCGGFRPYATSR